MSEWQGRTAVVTGAARGLGRAFATALAGEGAHVLLIDIDGAEAQAAAEDIRVAGGSAQGVAGDVCDEPRIVEAMAEAALTNGGIDLLVNNAGLHSGQYAQSITALGYARVRRLFDVNVMGVVCCTLAALPHMRRRAGASIVNIASSAAHMRGSAYGDSKLAVAGLTITLARELGGDGIRVNAISPGLMLTQTVRDELPEDTRGRIKAMQMIDVDGAEHDIVEALLYLASAKARFVTGEVLRVTGGMAAGV